jgi:hypothetical protein
MKQRARKAEDGGDILVFLPNVGRPLTDYTVVYP